MPTTTQPATCPQQLHRGPCRCGLPSEAEEEGTDAARNLADIAADRLVRLADDLAASAALPVAGGSPMACTLAEDRNEAAGALERLRDAPGFVDPATLAADKRTAAPPAGMQAKVIRDALRIGNDPAVLRAWADAWRAYAAAPVGEGQVGA